MAVNVTADPIVLATRIKAVWTTNTIPERDYTRDIAYNCRGYDSAGVYGKGILKLASAISGSWLNIGIMSDPIAVDTALDGSYIPGGAWIGPPIQVDTGITSYGMFLSPIEQSWVWSSKIGEFDFTEGISNDVTKQPMEWSGYCCKILKGTSGVVVYGTNGITLMAPQGLVWGRRELHPIGIKGHDCAVWTKRGHYAIDRLGKLVKVGLDFAVEITDYSNHFAQMSANTVMSYDNARDIVYICDGTYGYVLTQWGLGKGPINITGIGNRSGTQYSIAPAAVTFDALSIVTDIMDFGTRGEKTITEVQVGTYSTKAVQVAIDYRWNKASTFYTSPWVTADREGRAFITASGVEFKVRVKLAEYEADQIDYINVIGTSSTPMGNA